MDNPLAIHPIWVVAIDYVLGVIMWTLVGRTAMGFFLREDSDFFFMRFFVRATNPIIEAVCPDHPELPAGSRSSRSMSPGSFS